MLINGNVINGIFKYQPGLIFTLGDIVIYKALLYRVIDAQVSQIEPDTSMALGRYVEYTKFSSITDIAQYYEDIEDYGVDTTKGRKLITSGLLKQVIAEQIRGLNVGGEVTALDLETESPLDILETGIYNINVRQSIIGKLPPLIKYVDHLIMKVYKTAQGTVQEVIDYSTPAIYYRLIEDVPVGVDWITIGFESTILSDFQDSLNKYRQIASLSIAEADRVVKDLELMGTKYSFVDISRYISDETASIANFPINRFPILMVGVKYTKGGITYQDFQTLDPMVHNTTITADDYKLSYTISGSAITIEMIPTTIISNYSIIKLIGSARSI